MSRSTSIRRNSLPRRFSILTTVSSPRAMIAFSWHGLIVRSVQTSLAVVRDGRRSRHRGTFVLILIECPCPTNSEFWQVAHARFELENSLAGRTIL